ncbi:arylalkylamine N-acetyltransferase 1 [Condylostylus longicornis]|uniref:arylalkylamine N-acetyltransferase 1 n=1 Tax=Condylostylus longicornis TaxID=2530218 RepID=UPI00244D9973|nr:arylalkylamine N-acetyltransferase 1 [Condylostylus longicornis]
MDYKLITPEYYEEVIKHLRNTFFSDEPLNKAANLCEKGEGNPDLELHSYKTLEDNLSIMAITEDDEIAGVILNGLVRADQNACQKKLDLSSDENFKKIFNLLNYINSKVNFFDIFNIDKLFDIRILSVDSKYRGRGIAKNLIEHSIKIAKEFNFEIIKADATGMFSQKLLRSHGFDIMTELYYDKYVDEFGKPILKVESPHIKLQLLYKKIA